MPQPQPQPRPSAATAFTLIELLVVISIITLLIGLLLPVLGSARSTARSAVCSTRLRTLIQAARLYGHDHDHWLPEGQFPAGEWVHTLAQIIQSGDGTYGSGGDQAASRGVIRCPEAPDNRVDDEIKTSYSAHPRLMIQRSIVNDPAANYTRPLRQARQDTIRNPSGLITLFDGAMVSESDVDGVAERWAAAPVAWAIDNTAFFDVPRALVARNLAPGAGGQSIDGGVNRDAQIYDPSQGAGNFRWRHAADTATNAAFLDGHVETRRYRSRTDTDITRAEVYVDH